MTPDYYKILEVTRNASDAEIKKQYRRLARKYHPDVSKLRNAEKRFKEINEAYEVLKDKTKRQNYDQFGDPKGSPWQGQSGYRQQPGGNASNEQFNFNFEQGSDNFGGFGQGSFSDIFERMFNSKAENMGRRGASQQRTQQSSSRQNQTSADAKTLDIKVKLEDIVRGAEKIFNLTLPGEKEVKRIKVKIPQGITEGKKIRLSGQGTQGRDILLRINYEPHDYFQVDGNDLYLQLPITEWEAALGASVSVPTLAGNVEIKIPQGSQSGRKLRIKGYGLGKPAGELYTILQIKLPPSLNAEAEKLYQKLKQTCPFNPREHFR